MLIIIYSVKCTSNFEKNSFDSVWNYPGLNDITNLTVFNDEYFMKIVNTKCEYA